MVVLINSVLNWGIGDGSEDMGLEVNMMLIFLEW